MFSRFRALSNVLNISLNNTEHLFSKVERCLVMFSCWVVKRPEHFAEKARLNSITTKINNHPLRTNELNKCKVTGQTY